MRARSAVRLPAVVSFPGEAGRESGWGRLLELSASTAVLSTNLPLSRLERVLLSFELGGERFESLACSVSFKESDEDGYTRAELSFADEPEKRRLARLLLDVLARFC